MDRGFNGTEHMNWMNERCHYVTRLNHNRVVRPGTSEGDPIQVQHLRKTLTLKYKSTLRYVDKSSHEIHCFPVTYNWIPIYMEDVKHPVWLLMVHTERNWWYLVTNKDPKDECHAADWIDAYVARWGNEEVTRCIKQMTGLEGFRVRKLVAIQRLVMLSMIAMGLLAYETLRSARRKKMLLDKAKEFIPKVQFELYRLWRVLQWELTTLFARRRRVRIHT
jgi:hypothetical protein